MESSDYKYSRKVPFIPTEEELDALIAGARAELLNHLCSIQRFHFHSNHYDSLSVSKPESNPSTAITLRAFSFAGHVSILPIYQENNNGKLRQSCATTTQRD